MVIFVYPRCSLDSVLLLSIVNYNNMENIIGKCLTMCPKEESKMREKSFLVHKLEVINGERKLVKSYSRSAADMKMAVPSLLRPYPVLLKTVKHLLFEVTRQSDRIPSTVIYDFLNDRLRAVRQDMTIQRLLPEECVTLLDPMVRFHVYYGYKLCDCPIKDYDPVLNKKYLLECLKLFLSCYDRMESTKGNQNDIDCIESNLSNLDINNYGKKLKCDRILMESLYILCNLDDIHPLYRYFQLPEHVKRDSHLYVSYRIAVAKLHRNYVLVNKLSKELRPLEYCAFILHLPTIQRVSLQILSTAFSSKQLSVPCEVIKTWLGFNSEYHVKQTCRHYGIKVEGDKVAFNKTDFKNDVLELQPQKVIDINKEDIFTTLDL